MSRITKVEAFVFVTEFGSLICEKKLKCDRFTDD
jgi:hypothetical protein